MAMDLYLAMFENATKRAQQILQTFGINLMTRDVLTQGISSICGKLKFLYSQKLEYKSDLFPRYRQAETVRLAQEWELWTRNCRPCPNFSYRG